MDDYNENAGINRLANVLSRRIKKEGERPLILDFGKIQANGSLVTDTFPEPVPKSDYSVCEGSCLEEGDRTLVAWVGNEAVVIGKVLDSWEGGLDG